ncbi:methyltransferase domain-containing protein [Marivita sp. S0852]|uniref:methyltransferase domain-containing protein n=1 Tax=Marivita sp. S0852 TaxID=3373893 RepID=UPI003982261E
MTPSVSDTETPSQSAAEQELEQARARLDAGDRAAALAICRKYLSRDILLPDACVLSVLLRDLGETDAADQIRSVVLETVQAEARRDTIATAGVLSGTELLLSLDAIDEALAHCKQAHARAPDDQEIMNALVSLLINLDRLDEAQAVAAAYCDRNSEKFNVLIHIATIFSHFEARDFALKLLKLAEGQCTDKNQRAKIDYLLAANGAAVSNLDQHGMAVGLFDGFADSYDEKLQTLENNGPAMVLAALQDLGLPKRKTRRVLDAGCGTGLCAGFLRGYAKHLMGVDISVAMLEKSRARGIYDLLARTDLSIRATYPEDQYDMIVCADVLVYFGALDTVFGNFHDVLVPGGWLVFTVENESDPAVQARFKLYPSGRHKHSQDYLCQTLTRVGFPKPKLMHRVRLRNEMTQPVMGTVVAVQKSALAF